MEAAGGFLGIVKLTMQIMRSNFMHFLCIAVLWAVPYAFHLHVLDSSRFAIDTIVGNAFSLYSLIVSEQQFPSPAPLPPYNPDAPFPKLPLSSLSPIIATFFFSITIALISYPLLTISVCRACLNKSISLKSSLLGIPRSAKNLALTSLCLAVLVFGFFAFTIGVLAIIGGAVVLVRGNEPAAVLILVNCISIATGMGGLYLAISLSLANTVAMLEENTRAWGAMRRSMELLNGRKWVALGLVCVVYGILLPCEFSELWRWMGARIVRVSLQALISLFGMAAYVVLYMSCKIQREEPLNTLIAASPRFGPQESMDVETATFLPALPK